MKSKVRKLNTRGMLVVDGQQDLQNGDIRSPVTLDRRSSTKKKKGKCCGGGDK